MHSAANSTAVPTPNSARQYSVSLEGGNPSLLHQYWCSGGQNSRTLVIFTMPGGVFGQRVELYPGVQEVHKNILFRQHVAKELRHM
eukprot:SAG31_NODE_15195_length_766_cov_0.986507_1_plen_85_part_10